MNTSTELTVERERQLVKQLLDLVADRSRREEEIESRHASEISAEDMRQQPA